MCMVFTTFFFNFCNTLKKIQNTVMLIFNLLEQFTVWPINLNFLSPIACKVPYFWFYFLLIAFIKIIIKNRKKNSETQELNIKKSCVQFSFANTALIKTEQFSNESLSLCVQTNKIYLGLFILFLSYIFFCYFNWNTLFLIAINNFNNCWFVYNLNTHDIFISYFNIVIPYGPFIIYSNFILLIMSIAVNRKLNNNFLKTILFILNSHCIITIILSFYGNIKNYKNIKIGFLSFLKKNTTNLSEYTHIDISLSFLTDLFTSKNSFFYFLIIYSLLVFLSFCMFYFRFKYNKYFKDQ